MPAPDDPGPAFRRKASATLPLAVAGLAAFDLGLTALGYWLGGVWGLVAGAASGSVLLVAGLFAAAFLYAMSQDGA